MMDPKIAKQSLDQIGICFMMAPLYRTAMKNVMPVRTELGTRTIFNILGPMTNPADVKIQLTGAFDKLLEPMAQTLLSLGTKSAWLVHGGDGTDELSVSGISYVMIKNGLINKFTINPNDLGITTHPFGQLIGGDSKYNASELKHSYQAKSAYRDL